MKRMREFSISTFVWLEQKWAQLHQSIRKGLASARCSNSSIASKQLALTAKEFGFALMK